MGKAVLFILSLFLYSETSCATPGDATEVTQIMNNAELVNILKNGYEQLKELSSVLDNEIIQTAKQIAMVQNQLQDLVSLAGADLPFQQVSNNFLQVRQLVNRGMALSQTLQNLDQVFSDRYQPNGGGTYKQRYANWSGTTMDGVKSALQAQGLQNMRFDNELSVLQSLNSMSSNATGTVSVVQAGNGILLQLAQQLQGLRQMQMEQFNAYAGVMASEQASKDELHSKMDDITKQPVFKFGSRL